MKRPSKRLIIGIVIGLTCVLGAGAYTWQSLRTWRDYESRLINEQREYGELRKTAITGNTPKERLTAIRLLDDKVAKRGNLCDVNGLYAWQATSIPPVKEGAMRCKQKLKQLDLIAKPLHTLRQYLDTTERLQSSINVLVPTENLNESNWTSKGLASAKKVRTEIAALKVYGDAAELKTKATTMADTLVKSWEDLIKANAEKDKVAFLAASASVVLAYAQFAALADSADTVIKDKVDELMKVSSEL